jgi:hypothetical protein
MPNDEEVGRMAMATVMSAVSPADVYPVRTTGSLNAL